jgi:hypothetical protein
MSSDDAGIELNRSLLTPGPRKHRAVRHFPGTGPEGKCCIDCASFDQTKALKRTQKGRCKAWAAVRALLLCFDPAERKANPNVIRAVPTIPAFTLACKYFEEQQP